MILQRIEPTVALALCTLLVAVTAAMPMGVLAAWPPAPGSTAA